MYVIWNFHTIYIISCDTCQQNGQSTGSDFTHRIKGYRLTLDHYVQALTHAGQWLEKKDAVTLRGLKSRLNNFCRLLWLTGVL